MSRFEGRDGTDEYHLLVRPTEGGTLEEQLEAVASAYRDALGSVGLPESTVVLRRFFCSDLANQASGLERFPLTRRGEVSERCAVSWVGQAPAPPAKIALWAYHVRDARGTLDKQQDGAGVALRRAGLTHHWSTGITSPEGKTSGEQTREVFARYDELLRDRGMTLADHVARTWLFVRDIDANYAGLVAARRGFFAEHGLTASTHFIASSGIEGGQADPRVSVALDAYAIGGLQSGQVRYLSAPEHLSPTHVYGVTFERGTAIAYADRTHVILSGTASIDREGRIVHEGDVARQLDRTLENVSALLERAGAALDDLAVVIVYIRDPADYELADRLLRMRLGEVPFIVLQASVCRPGWLIEVEGLAIVPASNPGLPAF